MLKVASTIRAADRFDMSLDFNPGRAPWEPGLETNCDILLYDCKSTGCVAGWTMAVLGLDPMFGLQAAGGYLHLDHWEEDQLFYASWGSIWHRVAPEYGWDICNTGVVDWSDIKAFQVADVLERIVRGEIEFYDEATYKNFMDNLVMEAEYRNNEASYAPSV